MKKPTLPLIERILLLSPTEREALRLRALDPNSAADTSPFFLHLDKGVYPLIQTRNKDDGRGSYGRPAKTLKALEEIAARQKSASPSDDISSVGNRQKAPAPKPTAAESPAVAEPPSVAQISVDVASTEDSKMQHFPEGAFDQGSCEINRDGDKRPSSVPVVAADLPLAASKVKSHWYPKAVWASATLVTIGIAIGAYLFLTPVSTSSTMAAETRQKSTPDVEHLKALWQKLEARSGRVVSEMVIANWVDDRRLHLELVFYAMLRFSGGKLSIPNFQRVEHEIEAAGDFAGWLTALDQAAWMRPVAFRDNWGATSTSAGLSELFKTSLRSVTLRNGQLTMRGPGLGNAVRKILSGAGEDMPTDWHVVYAQDVVEIFEKQP